MAAAGWPLRPWPAGMVVPISVLDVRRVLAQWDVDVPGAKGLLLASVEDVREPLILQGSKAEPAATGEQSEAAGLKGGRGSGNFGHVGRPGEVGGSGPASARVGYVVDGDADPAERTAILAAIDSLPEWLSRGVQVVRLHNHDHPDDPDIVAQWIEADHEISVYPLALHMDASEVEDNGTLTEIMAHEAGHGVWRDYLAEYQGLDQDRRTALMHAVDAATLLAAERGEDWVAPEGSEVYYEHRWDLQRRASQTYSKTPAGERMDALEEATDEWVRARNAGEDGFTWYSKNNNSEKEGFAEFCLMYQRGGEAKVRAAGAAANASNYAAAFIKLIHLLGAPAEGSKGGKGSGNWKHVGRPGQVGGSGAGKIAVDDLTSQLLAVFREGSLTAKSIAGWVAPDGRIIEIRSLGATHDDVVMSAAKRMGWNPDPLDEKYRRTSHQNFIGLGFTRVASYGGEFSMVDIECGPEIPERARKTIQDLLASRKLKTIELDVHTGRDRLRPYFSEHPGDLRVIERLLGVDLTSLGEKGGKGSGNWKHVGRPGEVGGSGQRSTRPPDKLSYHIGIHTDTDVPEEHEQTVIAELDKLPLWLTRGVDRVTLHDHPSDDDNADMGVWAQWDDSYRRIDFFPLAFAVSPDEGLFHGGFSDLASIAAHEAGHNLYDRMIEETNRARLKRSDMLHAELLLSPNKSVRDWSKLNEERGRITREVYAKYARENPIHAAMIKADDAWTLAVDKGEDGVTGYSTQAVRYGLNSDHEIFAELAMLYTKGGAAKVRAVGVQKNAQRLTRAFLMYVKAAERREQQGRDYKGGEGSGNWRHVGRPGEVGGSAPSGTGPEVWAEDGVPAENKAAVERAFAELPGWLREGVRSIGLFRLPYFASNTAFARWDEANAEVQVFPPAFNPYKVAVYGDVKVCLAHECGHGVDSRFTTEAKAANDKRFEYVNDIADKKRLELAALAGGKRLGPKGQAERSRLIGKAYDEAYRSWEQQGTRESEALRLYQLWDLSQQDGVTQYSQGCYQRDHGSKRETFAELTRLYASGGEAAVRKAGADAHADELVQTWLDIIHFMGAPAEGAKGGHGSGNWKHRGRPGEVGGSAPDTDIRFNPRAEPYSQPEQRSLPGFESNTERVGWMKDQGLSDHQVKMAMQAFDKLEPWLAKGVKLVKVHHPDFWMPGLLGEWEEEYHLLNIYPQALKPSPTQEKYAGAADGVFAHEAAHGVWHDWKDELDQRTAVFNDQVQRQYEQQMAKLDPGKEKWADPRNLPNEVYDSYRRQLRYTIQTQYIRSPAGQRYWAMRQAEIAWNGARLTEDGFTDYSEMRQDREDEGFCEWARLFHEGGVERVRKAAKLSNAEHYADAFLQIASLMGAEGTGVEQKAQPEAAGLKGGKGSGNWKHVGRPGEVGGSAPASSRVAFSLAGDFAGEPDDYKAKRFTQWTKEALDKLPEWLSGGIKTIVVHAKGYPGDPSTYATWEDGPHKIDVYPLAFSTEADEELGGLEMCLAHEAGHGIKQDLVKQAHAAHLEVNQYANALVSEEAAKFSKDLTPYQRQMAIGQRYEVHDEEWKQQHPAEGEAMDLNFSWFHHWSNGEDGITLYSKSCRDNDSETFAEFTRLYAKGGSKGAAEVRAAAKVVGAVNLGETYLRIVHWAEREHARQASSQKGGEGSGNWKHAGRRGKVGGSAPSSTPHGDVPIGEEHAWGTPSDYSPGHSEFAEHTSTPEDIESTSPLDDGVTHGERIFYRNDGSGIWKGLGVDEPGGHHGWHEVAAYEISELLGLDVVPETVYAKNDAGEMGTCQIFVENSRRGSKGVLDPRGADRAIKVMILDYITQNRDRHPGNYLWDEKNQIVAIDHGHALFQRRSQADNSLDEKEWFLRRGPFALGRQLPGIGLMRRYRVDLPRSLQNQLRKVKHDEFIKTVGRHSSSKEQAEEVWDNLQDLVRNPYIDYLATPPEKRQ
jgi:hypothetical protein